MTTRSAKPFQLLVNGLQLFELPKRRIVNGSKTGNPFVSHQVTGYFRSESDQKTRSRLRKRRLLSRTIPLRSTSQLPNIISANLQILLIHRIQFFGNPKLPMRPISIEPLPFRI